VYASTETSPEVSLYENTFCAKDEQLIRKRINPEKYFMAWGLGLFISKL